METELISFVTNQGLAIAISAFLVWWVTTQLGQQVKSTCDSQAKICENQLMMAAVLEKVADKLDAHDAQAKCILEKVDCIEKRVA